MANQYTLTNDFAEIAEEKGTLYNKGDSAIELASTADTAKGAGILLLTGERRTFSGTLYARSMDAAGLLNVADFNDGGEGGEDNLSGVPLGTILPYSANAQTPPYGFLYCEGQAISRTMYPDLFAAIGTTWGAGDGSTTFNLPRSEDLVMQGASATNPVGTYLSAGLPNITGRIGTGSADTWGPFIGGGGTSDGALLKTVKGHNGVTYGSSNESFDIDFDASDSNPIYGASDTVQPPAACVRFMIKAFDGQTPDSALIDITQYAQELATKATRSLDNLSADGENHIVNINAPDYSNGIEWSYSTGKVEQTYTVPQNGFLSYTVTAEILSTSSAKWGYVKVNDEYVIVINSAANGTQYQPTCSGVIRVLKNDEIKINSAYASGTYPLTRIVFFPQKEVLA